jgi:hypothetical protein
VCIGGKQWRGHDGADADPPQGVHICGL